MTGQDLVDGVRAEVVEPSPLFFTSANLLRIINRAQLNYVRRTRVLHNFATLSTVVGQDVYDMPPAWLAAEKIFWNHPVNGIDSWKPLTPTSLEKMSQESPNFLSSDPAQFGMPQKYWIENRRLHIYPRPITSTPNDIFMFFDSKPIPLTTLADSLSVDDSLADGVEAYLLWKMWKQDREQQDADEQKQRFADEIGLGLKWKKQKVLDGKWKLDIESWLPFNYSSVNNSAFNNQLNPLNL